MMTTTENMDGDDQSKDEYEDFSIRLFSKNNDDEFIERLRAIVQSKISIFQRDDGTNIISFQWPGVSDSVALKELLTHNPDYRINLWCSIQTSYTLAVCTPPLALLDWASETQYTMDFSFIYSGLVDDPTDEFETEESLAAKYENITIASDESYYLKCSMCLKDYISIKSKFYEHPMKFRKTDDSSCVAYILINGDARASDLFQRMAEMNLHNATCMGSLKIDCWNGGLNVPDYFVNIHKLLKVPIKFALEIKEYDEAFSVSLWQ